MGLAVLTQLITELILDLLTHNYDPQTLVLEINDLNKKNAFSNASGRPLFLKIHYGVRQRYFVVTVDAMRI